MAAAKRKELRWIKEVRVPTTGAVAVTARERLLAALADRPQTVAQLAQSFGLAQPTMLEQVRRALRDGLIVEVQTPIETRRFPAERYYTPAVPVIRAPDRELLESACRGLADEMAVALVARWGDLQAAFALTHLAREGWELDDLWPYLNDTIDRLLVSKFGGLAGLTPVPPHGLAWVEDLAEGDEPAPTREELSA